MREICCRIHNVTLGETKNGICFILQSRVSQLTLWQYWGFKCGKAIFIGHFGCDFTLECWELAHSDDREGIWNEKWYCKVEILRTLTVFEDMGKMLNHSLGKEFWAVIKLELCWLGYVFLHLKSSLLSTLYREKKNIGCVALAGLTFEHICVNIGASSSGTLIVQAPCGLLPCGPHRGPRQSWGRWGTERPGWDPHVSKLQVHSNLLTHGT